MQTYQTYRRGQTPVGAIVVKLYVAGETVRGFLREIEDVEEDGTAFPSDELEPDVALRLAENMRQHNPSRPVFIELDEGVEWDPGWGSIK
jgi:hypothetical protein